MAARLRCWPHESGVDPTAEKTFSPDCYRCLELLAEGKRTGKEPPPRAKGSQRAFRRQMAVQFAEGRAKRKAMR